MSYRLKIERFRLFAAFVTISFLLSMTHAIGFQEKNRYANFKEYQSEHLEMSANLPEKVLPYWPFEVEIIVKNQSDEKFSVSALANKYAVQTRIETKDGELIYEGRCEQSLYSLSRVFPKIKLASGESKSFWVTLAHYRSTDRGRQPFFRKTGLYRISFFRPAIYVSSSDLELFEKSMCTDFKELRVVAEEEHRDALRAVREMEHWLFLLSPEFGRHEVRDDEEAQRSAASELDEFLEEHGDSPWAPHALLGRTFIPGTPAELRAEYAGRAARKAEEKGIAHLWRKASDMHARALGEMGEHEKAIEIFNALDVERHKRKGWELPEPSEPASKVLSDTIDELEKQGYDPTGLAEEAPDAWEEYRRIRDEALLANIEGELSFEEHYEIRAEALERLTLEHLEPISQEELQKRKMRREEEREHRRRQREKSRAYVEDLYEKLKAEGYDPEGLHEDAPEAMEIYWEINAKFRKQYNDGEISYLEAAKKAAAEYERLVRQYTEPMSREELQERIARREDEQRRKRLATREKLLRSDDTPADVETHFDSDTASETQQADHELTKQ